MCSCRRAAAQVCPWLSGEVRPQFVGVGRSHSPFVQSLPDECRSASSERINSSVSLYPPIQPPVQIVVACTPSKRHGKRGTWNSECRNETRLYAAARPNMRSSSRSIRGQGGLPAAAPRLTIGAPDAGARRLIGGGRPMRCGRGETKIDATGTPITGTSRRHETLTAPFGACWWQRRSVEHLERVRPPRSRGGGRARTGRSRPLCRPRCHGGRSTLL